MQQIILGMNQAAISTSAANYMCPYGAVNGATATIADATQIAPEAGVVALLRVILSVAPGAGKSYTFTLYVNESPSALTCTISDAATSGDDTTHSVAIAAGDRLSLESTPAGTPSSTVPRWGFAYTPTAAGTAVLLGTTNDDGSVASTRYNSLGSSLAGWSSTIPDRAPVWNINATITALYIGLVTAPGAGKSRAFTIMKNGSEEASSTVTISDAATAGSVTGLTIDLAPGDTLALRTVPTGTPDVTSGYYWGMSYAPDTDGQFCITGIDSNAVAAADRYNSLTQYPIAWSSTSTDRTLKAGATSGAAALTAKSIRALLSAAPGAGDARTFALQVDGTPSALSVTISESDVAGADTEDVSLTIDQLLNIKHSITGTPASAYASVATLFQVPVAPDAGGRGNLLLLGVG